jgi:hypothetical protein
MDLVATTTRKDNVDVWRLNGQRVFGANFAREEHDEDDGEAREAEGEKEANVKGVVWRRDGESGILLASPFSRPALASANSELRAGFHPRSAALLSANGYRIGKVGLMILT